VTRYFYPEIGGTESYTLNLARCMVARGHSVTVHTSELGPSGVRHPANDIVDGIRVARYPLHLGANLVPKFDEPEIIHVNSFGYNPNIVEPLRRRTRWMVFTPIAMFMGRAYSFVPNLFVRRLLARYARIVALTGGEFEYLLRKIGVDQSRLTVIPAGVGEESFESSRDDGSSLASNVVREIPDFIFSLGRVVPSKHLWVGIRALSHLPQYVHYVIAGPILDQPHFRKLCALASRLNVGARVHFLGEVTEPDKRLLLSRAKVYLASGYEAFSIASVEAMAQGKAVVAARKLGLPDVVLDGTTGLTFDYDEPDAAALSLSRIMDDTREAQRLGLAGRARAWENFRWVAIAESMAKLYGDVLNEPASHPGRPWNEPT
jgi:glycosyltransferase involved in cell wall biosynthesis